MYHSIAKSIFSAVTTSTSSTIAIRTTDHAHGISFHTDGNIHLHLNKL
ncbi:hypothetical protein [Prolixibacter denitrificans]|nr:hypothetical protein [Prolixibacter denitrificans]